jgi:outer membrane receptor protein involved in Fe transport
MTRRVGRLGQVVAGAAVLCFAAAPRAGAGQAPAAPGDEPDLSLEAVLGMEVQSVFGASKFLQKTTEAPAAVTIVTAEEIDRYGWRTLAEILRSVRGFYVTDDRMWGYVGVRGFQRPGDYNTRLLLLVDGERINDNVFDQALVQEDFVVDAADIERVEIIRGPASSLYGSNAFFGVINVVTRPPATSAPLSGVAELGTLGRRTGRVTAAHQWAGGLAARGTFTAQAIDGLDRVYFAEFDAPATNDGVAHALDYTRRVNATGTLAWRGVAVRAAFNSRTRGYPSASFGTLFNDPVASVRDDNAFVSAAWDGALGHGWTSNVRLGWHAYEYVGHYPYASADGGASEDNVDAADGQWLTGEGRLSRLFGGRHRVTVGGEIRSDLTMRMRNFYDAAEPLLDLRRRSRTLGAYVQDEWRLHRRLLVSAGLRQDHYGALGDPLKPRMAVVFQPAEGSALKLLYGGAFRAANAYEREYEVPSLAKGNPDLRPEEIRTVEGVGEFYLGRRVRLSGSVFRYGVDRLIDLEVDPADGLAHYVNRDAAHASGLEGEIEAKWPVGVQARASYTYARVRDDAGLPLSNAPAHVGQALFSAPLGGGAFVGVDARAISSRLSRDGGRVSPYVVGDVTVSGPLWGSKLRYAVALDNVGNHTYADPVSPDFVQPAIVQNGRTAHLRLQWSY